ncbi:MAG: DUF308 domain-containing protein [Planctomycetota bacterium]
MTSDTAPDMTQMMAALAKDWWLLLIRGVLLIILGIYAVLMPAQTLVTFCLIFGIFLIIDAVFSLASFIGGGGASRGWALARGLITLVLGLLIVGSPAVFGAAAALVLVYLIAAGMVIGGVAEIAAVVQHKQHAGAWVFIHGLLAIVFGLVLALLPLIAMAALIMVAGIYAIIFGVALIVLSFRLKNAKPGEAAADSPAAAS